MQHRKLSIALAGIMLAATSFAASADILFQNLGTAAPPASVGGHTMTPFSLAPQSAIPELSSISEIPGNPFAGQLTVSPQVTKYTGGFSWGTDAWPGAYLGPIYFSGFSVSSRTLTLPPNTTAFYFYLQNNNQDYNLDTVIVTTNSGTTSGPIELNTGFREPNVGAIGLAVYSTAGESITSITVQSSNTQGFGIGNFGISNEIVMEPEVTCASEGYTGTKLTWCKNICENGLTGATLDMWIHRWVNRYRDLPYCARDDEEEESPSE